LGIGTNFVASRNIKTAQAARFRDKNYLGNLFPQA
jgi:hypothetical protein